MMAGGGVALLTSALLKHGTDHLKLVRAEMVRRMEEHGDTAVRQMQGSMSPRYVSDPGASRRANSLKVLRSSAPRGAGP